METRRIDLHVHSNASDGTFTPTELLTAAKAAGLSAMALTDHDTTSGIAEAASAAEKNNIEFIPGVELSTDYHGKEIHVLGLYIHPDDPVLNKKMQEFRDCRDHRNELMIKRLQEEGFDITIEALNASFPDAVVTRAHIARFMLDHHMIPTMRTAFDRYIGDGCKCYVARTKVNPMDAAAMICDAGGVAVLAHPVLYHLSRQDLLHLIHEMQEYGLKGIEAIYSENSLADEQEMKKIAHDHQLLITGGSDFHGSNKPDIQLGKGRGKLYIPYDLLSGIKQAAGCYSL